MNDFKSYSIKEFCRSHCISTAKFHILKRKGLAPDMFRIDNRIYISAESAARWLKKQEEQNKLVIIPRP